MTSESEVMIDTNVILDVTEEDEHWASWSEDRLSEYVGCLIVSPVVYAELCYEAEEIEEVDAILLSLGLKYLDLTHEALFLASKAFKQYRKQGGRKTTLLADFFIGGQAAALGIPILTRDVRRYRTYFPSVTLISP